MELHAFEEMARGVDASLPGREEENMDYQPPTVFPAVTPPGMAYVPYQQWSNVYEPEKGIKRGTIFPVLDLPFAPDGGDCRR